GGGGAAAGELGGAGTEATLAAWGGGTRAQPAARIKRTTQTLARMDTPSPGIRRVLAPGEATARLRPHKSRRERHRSSYGGRRHAPSALRCFLAHAARRAPNRGMRSRA